MDRVKVKAAPWAMEVPLGSLLLGGGGNRTRRSEQPVRALQNGRELFPVGLPEPGPWQAPPAVLDPALLQSRNRRSQRRMSSRVNPRQEARSRKSQGSRRRASSR